MPPTELSSPSTSRKPYFIGIDVGGTNIKIGLVDDAGQTLAYHAMPTEQGRGAEHACARVARVVRCLIADAGIEAKDVVRTGVATPGPLDIPNGMLLRPGNLPGWWDFPIRDRMVHHLNLPTTLANDANAAAYGEYWRGAGAKYESMVMLTLGTGIGGGIIVGDKLIEGTHGCGSECGHILVDPHDGAPHDSLGKSGSLEAYACAGAVVSRAKAALDAGGTSRLSAKLAAREELTPRTIAEAAEEGDQVALKVVMDTAYWLAIGIVSLIHTIDPDAVVLGGAMNFGGPDSPLGRQFIQRICDEVKPRLLEPLRDELIIEFASLGGGAGYIGAAGLARLEGQRTGS